MIRAILFDLDGLMVDSEPHSLASWSTVLATRGIKLEQAIIDRMFGTRLIDTAHMLIKLYSLSDQPTALAREKEEYQITHLHGRIKPMPGLFALLATIDKKGLHKAIASSGVRPYVAAVLAEVGLTNRFQTMVTGEEVVHGKPAPDIFLAAARALRVEPRECLVLEDAPNGVSAAKAAGMRAVAIPNAHTRELDFAGADWVLPSLAAVRDNLDLLINA
ncbi:MAG: HAD family hydrolase [Candidatus Binatia bacterium]